MNINKILHNLYRGKQKKGVRINTALRANHNRAPI